MKKVLSLALAFVICVSSMSLSLSAFGATSKTAAITLNGTMYGGIVEGAINKINESRAYYGYPQIQIDSTLTDIAETRAAEIMLHADAENDSRPDGSSITTLISGYDVTEFTSFNTISSATSDSLESELYSLSYNLEDIKSIGVGVFGYKDTYSCYAVLSTNDAVSTPTLTTRSYSKTVNVAVSKFTKKGISATDLGKLNYSFATKFYANGLYREYVTIPNSQITYSSSNKSVFKVKGNKGYHKKNGKFTVYAKLKDGTLVDKISDEFTGLNSVFVRSISVKSSKKKTMTVSWSANISDVEGYQIQYSTNKNFKKGNKTVNVKGRNTTKKTIKKLKSKKKYYVRIRAYIDQGDGEKVYTKWSKVKNIKVK